MNRNKNANKFQKMLLSIKTIYNMIKTQSSKTLLMKAPFREKEKEFRVIRFRILFFKNFMLITLRIKTMMKELRLASKNTKIVIYNFMETKKLMIAGKLRNKRKALLISA